MEDQDLQQSLHRLRFGISHCLQEGKRHIPFFSCHAGEGTSTIVLQLAQLLATRSRLRVLLVDANPVRPILHKLLAARREEGFFDLLAGKIDAIQAVQDRGDVDLISCGELGEHPARLLAPERLRRVLPVLGTRFDCVLYDCAPVIENPEMEALLQAADGAVMILEAERTRREVARAAQRSVEAAGAHLIGAVLNRRKFHIPAAIYRRL